MTNESIRFIGRIGLWATVSLALILLIHPFGTTDLYDDGEQFLDHVNAYWITIHVLAALVFLVYPIVIDAWSRGLDDPRARVVARGTAFVAATGAAVGTIHLIGTDTMTFVFFEDTFNAGDGSEAVRTSADLLLRFHAATLFAWVLIFWMVVPALLMIAARLEGKLPVWFGAIAGVAALLQVAALAVTVSERQWTTLSEMVLFRSGATLLIVLFLLLTMSLRNGSAHEVTPRQLARS